MVTHSYSSSPMKRWDHEGNITSIQKKKQNKKNPVTHTPKNTPLLFSLSPLHSQFFRLCVCSLRLWHNPVFEKPLRTLLSLCAPSVFMQACTLVSPCTVHLSSSFDKLTCKEGLFTRLRGGHVPPPVMQAQASLRFCQSGLILRAWSFAMC